MMERQSGRHLRDNLGEGTCQSKVAARQWGVNLCLEGLRCLAGPLGSYQDDFLCSPLVT